MQSERGCVRNASRSMLRFSNTLEMLLLATQDGLLRLVAAAQPRSAGRFERRPHSGTTSQFLATT